MICPGGVGRPHHRLLGEERGRGQRWGQRWAPPHSLAQEVSGLPTWNGRLQVQWTLYLYSHLSTPPAVRWPVSQEEFTYLSRTKDTPGERGLRECAPRSHHWAELLARADRALRSFNVPGDQRSISPDANFKDETLQGRVQHETMREHASS